MKQLHVPVLVSVPKSFIFNRLLFEFAGFIIISHDDCTGIHLETKAKYFKVQIDLSTTSLGQRLNVI